MSGVGPPNKAERGSFPEDAFEVNQEKSIRYIAAIDIGTNSTHLLIAKVDPSLRTFSIDRAEKSTTRLGELDPDSGELTKEAMERTIETLRRYKELAFSYDIVEIVSAATSAVREAPNGNEFITSIKEVLDLDVNLVSGAEEARLIYLGVLSGMSFGQRPHLLLDIGGGSTELILADSSDAQALTSTRVGAVRIQRDFVKQEPISSSRLKFLKTFIQGSFEPAVEKIGRRLDSGESPLMVATSGTAMAVGMLIASNDSTPPLKLHGYTITTTRLNQAVEKLLKMTPEERRRLTPLSDRRAEIIVPGALILQTIMQMLEVNKLVLSERALREGLIVDWMLRHGFLVDRFSLQGNIRKRTVMHQAHRFAVDKVRSERVARYALILYDNTFGVLHNDQGEGRELLWAAAMLHACGKHINRSAYHKHSWYLILNGDLLGYSQAEHVMVACIARYHRRSLPKKRHEAWQSLTSKDHRRIVFDMSMILRLASALDQRPEMEINSIRVLFERPKLCIKLIADSPNQSLQLEEWSLMNSASLIKEYKEVELTVC